MIAGAILAALRRVPMTPSMRCYCICVDVSTEKTVDTIVGSGLKLNKVGWLDAYGFMVMTAEHFVGTSAHSTHTGDS